MTKKRKIIYITIAAAIVIIAALAIIFMPKTAPQTVTEMLSTAQKYLVEMDYERAIAEFNKVIKLDPMNADAYLGLAEAYEKSGDIDKAIETLEKGFELTGDERLQVRLALLNGENTDNAEVSETEASIDETTAETEAPEEFITIKGEQYSTRLTELTLRSLELTDSDIKELNKMTNLTDLDLYENQISDISVLSELTNLTSLALSENTISDISALSGLTNLKHLYLGRNQISDISALSELTNLKTLHLDGNQISDINSLSKLLNLTYLELGNNQINDISVLSELTNLTNLHLDRNQISNINSLSELTKLSRLDLSENQISDISALSGLTSLYMLHLNQNQISNISALSGLTSINNLSIFKNPIPESDIEALKSTLPDCNIS